MLQVALAPAAVAVQVVEQVGRRLLPAALVPAAGPVGQHPHVPAGAQQQRRLHRVVAQDLAAQRRAARQRRQAAMAGEGGDAHDRVVAPVAAARPLPPRHAAGQQRPVQPGAELLHAGEQGGTADRVAHGLDQPGIRVRLHRAHQPRHRRAGHQAVGVQHDHEVVLGAPATDELGDVARLAPAILRPATVVHLRPAGRTLRQQPPVRLLLRRRARGGPRVAEHEQVGGAERLARQRPGHHAGGGEHAHRVLLVDRQQHGGAGPPARRPQHRPRNRASRAPPQRHQRAQHRTPGRQCQQPDVERDRGGVQHPRTAGQRHGAQGERQGGGGQERDRAQEAEVAQPRFRRGLPDGGTGGRGAELGGREVHVGLGWMARHVGDRRRTPADCARLPSALCPVCERPACGTVRAGRAPANFHGPRERTGLSRLCDDGIPWSNPEDAKPGPSPPASLPMELQ